MPTCFVVASSLQILCCLHKDIKKPLQVCGASAVLGVELHTAGAPSETQPHIPSPTPGQPCTYLKKGLCSCTSPSLEPSLALVKSGAQPGGRLPASTAKPWFCAVMKQRCVSSCTHGWLCPRFPYLEGGGRRAQNITHPTGHQETPGAGTPLTSSCRCGRPRRGPAAGDPGTPRRWAWGGQRPAGHAGWPLSAGTAVGPRGHC